MTCSMTTNAIVSYLPAERLNDLIEATGFDLGNAGWEYRFAWLKERIGILREQAARGNILHDNPKESDLIALIQHERRYSQAQRNTIEGLRAEIEKLRGAK